MVDATLLMTGRICIAAYTHEPTKTNELGFAKGDLVTVLSELLEDGQHYQASTADGEIGLLPSSAIMKRSPIPMLPMPWFHSTISRLDAEKLLDRNQNGQFLLRTSQNTKGVYALALSYNGKVKHYLVAMDFKNRKMTINGERYFSNLPALVEFYMKDGGDLGVSLMSPIIRRSTLEFHIDQETLKEFWGVSKSEVDLGDAIDQGEFGEVHLATYRSMQVAVKTINEAKQSAAALSSLLREAAVMTHLQHKNLVQLVGLVFQGSAFRSIVMELMGKGSLQKYLISRGRSVVSPAEQLHFARDVCEGMVYLSTQKFVHRDLAARNVLLNRNGQAKISDFGLTRRADIHVPHEGGKFPVKWTAPEALKESKFTEKSDVWSFGIFLWEVYSFGRTPYPSIPADEVLENLEDGIVMDPPDACPDKLYDIMCGCWEMEPTDRPNFVTLRQLLSKNFGESHTPHSSPIDPRKVVAMPSIEQLVSSPIATKSYQEAPFHRKATVFLSNIAFLGPLGSGKTSLLRSLTGYEFRLMEPVSKLLSISDGYYELQESLDSLSISSGLVYEDELVRIIVEDLLKHAHSVLSSPVKTFTGNNSSNSSSGGGSVPPPLPPPRGKKRSMSFTDSSARVDSDPGFHSNPDSESSKAMYRLSGSYEVIESGTPEGKLQLGIRPQPVADMPGSPGRRKREPRNRKSFLSKLRSKVVHKDREVVVRRHYSDSVKRTNYAAVEQNATDGGAGSNGGVPTPQFYSSLPERLIEKIRKELVECSTGTLTPKYFGKLIDVPGHPAFRVLKNLFISESSICILTFDASKDITAIPSPGLRRRSPLEAKDVVKQNGINGQPLGKKHSHTHVHRVHKMTYLDLLFSEIGDICLQLTQLNCDVSVRGPRIILVGTHSDKVSSIVSHRNFELIQEKVKNSPYSKYVTAVKFIVSSSSILERSSIDDLKHYLMETVKRSCRQQVPLKWLRCIRRFQGLSKNRVFFMSLANARKLISEICDVTEKEEVENVLQFLHRNQVILHFHRIHQLKDVIITDPRWFARQVSAIFGATTIDLTFEGAPDELLSDQHQLYSTGVFSNQLLDFVWKEKDAHANKDELLTLMHKMDLLICMASDSQPLSLAAGSVADITKEVGTKKKHPPKIVVSSVIVPALVEEPTPPQLSTQTSYDVEPLVIRFKEGHIPSGLFSRLIVRCIQSYPTDFAIFQNAATFVVDPTSRLMLIARDDTICANLYRIRCDSEDFSVGLDVTDLDNLLTSSTKPNPDTCMAILMFIQATLSDLIRQWMPHLNFDLCIECKCKSQVEQDVDDAVEVARKTSLTSGPNRLSGSSIATIGGFERHYVLLNDVDSLSQKSSLWCEAGSKVQMSASLLCWFGEVPASSRPAVSPSEDVDILTDEDIEIVIATLGSSWQELGETLGFSQRELEKFSLTSQSLSDAGEKMLREWQSVQSQNATFFALLGALEIVHRREIADQLVAARMTGGEGIEI